MVCVTYTAPVAPPPPAAAPVVSDLQILGTSGATGLGIKFWVDNPGIVKVYVDGVLVLTYTSVGIGYAQMVVNVGNLAVNHQICVE